MKKFLIIGILIAAVALFLVHKYLGGNEEISFTISEEQYSIRGSNFVGKQSDPRLETLFIKAREASLKSEGYALAILNYPTSEGTLNQTIGIISKTEDTDFAGHFDIQKQIKGQFIKTIIEAHNLVMPQPEYVLQQAEAFARDNDVSLKADYSIEIYESKRRLIVLFPLD